VIFTKNPVHTKQDEMFLEYCEGLGEDLVSGKVTPYSCVIERSTQKIHHIKEQEAKAFNDDEISKLFRVALEVERDCGGPQDIEWAFDGKNIYLLQTRPITETIIPDTSRNIDNVWTRANIGEVLPNVITPLTWDIFRVTLFNNPAFAVKLPIDDTYFDNALRLINGRGYLKLRFFLDSFCYLPYVTPEIMKHVLGVNIGTQACSYKRPTGISVKLAQSLFILDTFKVFPRISLMLKKLPDIPSRETDNLEKLIKWNAQCFHLHIKCTAYSIGAFALMSHYLYKWFPSEAEGLLSLILTGNENLQTAKQGISLCEISYFIRKKHELQDVIKKNIEWTELIDELGNVEGGSQFLGMLQEFLNKNGARAVEEFELAVPRWKEEPNFVINILRKYLDIPVSESYAKDISVRRSQRDKTINDIKSSLTKIQWIIFNQLLSSYADFCTLRENIKYRLMEGYCVVRIILLDIGSQLVSKGIFVNKNDIFFLRLSEVLNIIKGEQSYCEPNELITNRKVQHGKWEKQNAPGLICQDGTQADTMESNNNLLTGIGCSPGTVEGYARVLKDISEMKYLQPGEILVTPHTDPGWTPLFLSCNGIVTEIGGFLSHGATVAREYGVPAVVGVPGATDKIRTGDLIVVDGNNGVVTLTKK
jgi:rifampicin phosphotransferase